MRNAHAHSWHLAGWHVANQLYSYTLATLYRPIYILINSEDLKFASL